jgi:hypothetical protein
MAKVILHSVLRGSVIARVLSTVLLQEREVCKKGYIRANKRPSNNNAIM